MTRRRSLACLALLGLTGCPTVDLGGDLVEPGVCHPDPTYFHDEIWPNYLNQSDPAKSCTANAGCHSSTDGRSALRLEQPSGPTDTATYQRNYEVVIRFLNCSSPDASPLLTKPLAGTNSHGGGDIWPNTMDPAVMTFDGWFP
jgi:hypothetical protein